MEQDEKRDELFKLEFKLKQLQQLQSFNRFKRRILSETQVLELNREISSIVAQIEELNLMEVKTE